MKKYKVDFDLVGLEIRNKKVIWYLAEGVPTLEEINSAAATEFIGISLERLKFHFSFFSEQKGLFALNTMVMTDFNGA
ncbi:MAG: hypothetical protein A3I24_01500 [Candidatus Harrisonbacteria bacterium RIFCSPLOWO2_02_FULL_41_13b]|uniref:Uncharacterized protein n=1 Tax=Candidatus Harrisonbacteria bacterium RIFCSPLOWO2_02_FULL_41_13b TaxID=1798409 RepID=A0A1G1ZVR0_9BACT|nr:MAG: hypothetical protein A3J53_01790 [Candidatus Harrisonbacteria bacterium RIFCSPHIGHO2_02_FULL_40_20]OGY67830.1 MAG: hypothetical protein A3I24_01500 [Candidatus Harrisonbacteria bacterium RIFCSPLOWO2_02_FULL_41_13b]